MKYSCPVCAFTELEEEPAYFTICPSCGTEFGYHDLIRGHDELRALWITTGPRWHSTVIPIPYQWNGWEQLRIAGLIDYSPIKGNIQTEVAVVEIGQHSTIVDMPTGSARITATYYGVDRIVDLLGKVKFAGINTIAATAPV